MRLSGKVAIVTGGAQGIGRATVEKFHAEGAQVAIFDIDEPRGQDLAKQLAGGDRTPLFVRCDITDETQIEAATSSTLGRFGQLDILVNNAGVNAYFDAATMTAQEWDGVFAIDLKGAWLCTRYAIPAMRRAGGGAIVNIASIHAFMTIDGMFPYAAAKAGVVGMTRSLALDLGKDNIRVNAICPGWTRTQLVQEWFDQQSDPIAAEARVRAVHPLGRIGTPADIANLIAFVASDEAAFINGAPLMIDGGLSAQFAH
jgi:NAD(P)-dependent dehydrogenase (short-subunit alcohol dehydrogenase family)